MTRYTLFTLYLTSDPKRLLGKLKNNEVSQGLLQIRIEKTPFDVQVLRPLQGYRITTYTTRSVPTENKTIKMLFDSRTVSALLF